jgi:hypothetical protein
MRRHTARQYSLSLNHEDDHKRNEEILEELEELKLEPVDEKLRRYKIKLATTCNKNKQQQDAQNNTELYTKRTTTTTWKTFEETVRRG